MSYNTQIHVLENQQPRTHNALKLLPFFLSLSLFDFVQISLRVESAIWATDAFLRALEQWCCKRWDSRQAAMVDKSLQSASLCSSLQAKVLPIVAGMIRLLLIR
ncbi:hypothetical protein N7G274_010196 [Stereocaulon virgatum]|uniref:Uncharacterized protein n=1 Tax=Stereocaulon virgatum TaxID=373712 RepID=A0ABR3ZX23_9LECA